MVDDLFDHEDSTTNEPSSTKCPAKTASEFPRHCLVWLVDPAGDLTLLKVVLLCIFRHEMFPLDEFMVKFTPIAMKVAEQVYGRYRGWFPAPAEELKDIRMLAAYDLRFRVYPSVDFNRTAEEIDAYVRRRIFGLTLNCINKYLHSNCPSFVVSVADDNTIGGFEENESPILMASSKSSLDRERTGEHAITAKAPAEWYGTGLSLDGMEETNATGTDPSEELHLLIFKSGVLEAISDFLDSKCTPKERFIFMSRFRDEESITQIARNIGHNRSTVKSTVNRLIGKLKDSLNTRYRGCLKYNDVEDYLYEADLWVLETDN